MFVLIISDLEAQMRIGIILGKELEKYKTPCF